MDNNFDPDAYLAAKAPDSGGFDPDAYLAEKQGPVESAARGALRNIPLAQQAAAAIAPINPWSDKSNYSDELAHLTEAAEQGKAQNPKSYYTGAAAGTLAPLLIPGVGEAAEAARGAGMAGGAIQGAAQGLSDTNLTRDPARIARDAIPGAVIGGALGKVFGGAPKAAPAAESVGEDVAPKVAAEATAPAAEAAAQPAVSAPVPKVGAQIDATNIPEGKKVAADFVPSADRIYASNLAQGMGWTPRQLMRVFGKKDPVQSTVKIGNWMETAGEGGKSLNGLIDRPGELLQKIDALHDSSGKVIGGIIDKLGTEGDVDTASLLQELRDFSLKTADPATAGRIDRLVATTERNLEKGVGDFDSLQEIKSMTGKQLKKDPEMAEVYGHLADKLEAHVDQLGASLKDPAMAQAYAKAKLDYTNSSRLLPLLQYSEAKDLVGGPAGHHTLRGLLGNIFNMASSLTVGTTPEQLGKNVMLKAAPIARGVAQAGAGARTAVTNAASKAIPKAIMPSATKGGLSRAAQLELTNALESKFGKGK